MKNSLKKLYRKIIKYIKKIISEEDMIMNIYFQKFA